MSHIFDALQRAESEQTGVDSPVPTEATELLLRTERREASAWETASRPKNADFIESIERENPIGNPAKPSFWTEKEPQVDGEVSLAEGDDDVLSQFQTLEVIWTPQSRLVSLAEEASLAAEAFRLLVVRLIHIGRARKLKKVLITSTLPQEGKSMVAANLACTLARKANQKVLLLEGDLRRPSLSEEFGIGKNPGLFEFLEGERALKDCIYKLEKAGLWILPAGSAHGNALEFLQSGRLSDLNDLMCRWFDWIVIDSPPVLPLADTSVWARLADGILLVIRQGATEKRHLLRGLEAIESKKLIGALVNCSQISANKDYYYSTLNTPRQPDDSKN